MLTRAFAEKVVLLCTEKADFEDFQKHTAPCFVYEFMGHQPYAGEWHGANAVKRQFTVFNENFTGEFEVTATEIYVDSEKRTAAVRLQSHPLPIGAAASTGSIACGSCTSMTTTRSPE